MIKYMTVYSNNLKEPHKSFSTGLTVKDFNGGLQWDMAKALRVTYVNPKGEAQVIKLHVPKRGIYDVE